MAQVPLGVGAYSRPFGKLPEIRCENRFFEENPVGAEKVALLSRPGTKLFLQVGVGPIRTMHSQYGVFDGDLFIVSGEELFRYSGGVTTPITGAVLGTGYPIMASVAIPGWEALFITDGLKLQYYDGLQGGVHSLKACSVPDNVPIADLAVLASHIICAQKRSRKFFWIKPGETDIEPLSFSSMEAEPDEIVNILTVGDQLWIFGQSSTEAWYASGDDEQPFLRAQGRAFSQGILPGTLARNQETIIVVGQDRVAYRIVGSPERISHHGIEEMLRQWEETVDIAVTIDFTFTAERIVQFTGSAATSIPIATWSWDFSDGSPPDVSGPTPLHTFPSTDLFYAVTLTVTDVNGRTGVAQILIFVETLLIAPTAFAGVWSRTGGAAEQIVLSWTDPNPFTAARARRVYRDAVQIADLAAGVTNFTHLSSHATVPLGGEVMNNYTVRYYSGADLGVTAAASVWSGPLAPTIEPIKPGDVVACSYTTRWIHGNIYAVTEIEDDYLNPGVFVLRKTSVVGPASDVVTHGVEEICSGAGAMIPVSVRIRHKLTTFSVNDFSQYAIRVGDMELCNICTP